MPFRYPIVAILPLTIALTPVFELYAGLPYPIVDTGQHTCHDAAAPIPCPRDKGPWSGQDAQFDGDQPSYKDLGDGTIRDEVTGLMWVKEGGQALRWDDAAAGAKNCRVGGHHDWRLPSLKELYSLMDFGGTLNIHRPADAQDWSANEDMAPAAGAGASVFGVNFIDGHIRSYPKLGASEGTAQLLYVRYVRGNRAYGHNDFAEPDQGAVLDQASGLSWAQEDSRHDMDWQDPLAWVQARNAEGYFGHSDWRLPNAKELQSLVDYRRGPDITDSPAIDPVFSCTMVTDETGKRDYPSYWTSTTHRDALGAVTISFGRASDAIRVLHYVRMVRGGVAKPVAGDQSPARGGASSRP